MSGELRIFLIILIINAIVSIIYLFANKLKYGDMAGGYVIKTIMMLAAPVVGPLVILTSQIIFKLFFRREVSLADVVFSKERVQTFVHAEEDRERNMVPIEEAIQVTNTSDLRNLMMGAVRGDVKNTLSSISLALNSDDSEISHYAAAVLQDALNEFRERVDTALSRILDEDSDMTSKEREELCSETLDFMNGPLQQGVLSGQEQDEYVHKMERICSAYYDMGIENLSCEQFEAVCLRLLEIEDFELCRTWCDRGAAIYPSTLTSYTCKLKLFFNSRKKDEFFRTLEELKSNPNVVVDNETLELIRVFG